MSLELFVILYGISIIKSGVEYAFTVFTWLESK